MSELAGQDIIFELRQDVAWITLNRPEARKALSEQALQQLQDAFERYAQAPSLRAVILRGAGPVFCAGGDVAFFRQLLELSPKVRREPLARYISSAHRAMLALAQIPAPVIAAV